MRYLTLFILLVVWTKDLISNVIVMDDRNETIVVLLSSSAGFGPGLSSKFFGHVVLANPPNACSSIDPSPFSNSSHPYICLIRRAECSFVEKVVSAQKSGFKAVLIYDPESNELITMSGTSEFINIPSFFIGKLSEEILSNYLGRNYTVELEDNYPNSYGFLFFPLAIAIPLCLVFTLCFMLIKCVYGSVKMWKSRLSKSVLKLLPLRRFKKGDNYEVCAVCLEDFKVNDKLRILPCSHAYHQNCIDPWLTENKRTCPLCNKKVFPNEEDTDDEFIQVSNELTPLMSQTFEPSTSATPALLRFVDEALSSTDSERSSNMPCVESNVEVHVESIEADNDVHEVQA